MALLQLKVTRQEDLMCTSLSSLGRKGDIVDIKFVTYRRDETPEIAAEGQVTLLRLASSVFVCRCVHEGENVKRKWECLSVNLASSLDMCHSVFCIFQQDNRCMFIVFHSTTTQSKCDGLMDSSIVVMRAKLEMRQSESDSDSFVEEYEAFIIILQQLSPVNARNREAHRRQRESPKFREADRARARAYYVRPYIIAFDDTPNEGIICGSCGLILKHVEALRAHRAEFHPRQFGELREYVLGTAKTVEKLAVYGAASSNSIEEQKLSVPSDLISMLKHFILRRILLASSDLTGTSEKSN
ncbi:unnamed protein product [Brugia pahangi]|uniref:C2H2-type domain-containing protein n=1 Tax=Brugia pahangi TaxID=6280 RepID=A0A0N4SZI9_BRUPA|nr:unnamed protein product [Brugia pahangi]